MQLKWPAAVFGAAVVSVALGTGTLIPPPRLAAHPQATSTPPIVVSEPEPHARPAIGGASVLFGGDMMFDRAIRAVASAHGGDHLFDCIDGVLKSADLVVANLEGPITPHPSKSLGSTVGSGDNFIFTFPTSTAALLLRHNIRVVNIGNNHIENFGAAGVRSTIRALQNADVSYFGDPLDAKTAVGEAGGVRLAFIGYNQFGDPAAGSTAVSHVHRARDEGYIPVVYTHWGDEYVAATESEVALAHELVDAGAALVIGSHPHIVQEHEMYKNVHVYYSLGNFFFDQYWNDAVRHGLLVRVEFDKNGVRSVSEIPIELTRDGKTCPL